MPSRFVTAYSLADLIPASYNPRRITEAALTELRASIRTLGVVKPIIVTETRTIVAGHQRTKGMEAEGLTHCPAFVLPPVGTADEVRFNQLHNASDLDRGAERVRVPPSPSPGFAHVPAAAIRAETLRVRNAPKKTEILRLLSKYGEWGGCVATQSGEVLVSGLYALCCHILAQPCLVCYVPDDARPDVERFFGRPYGEFSYAHLPKTTWAQSLAQMMRLRERKTGRLSKDGDPKGKSRTYEHLVIPRLEAPEAHGLPRDPRVLDFGAGQMDYARTLRRAGVDILPLEFYLRLGQHLNVPQVHRDIDVLCDELAKKGRFDLVVCDSVLNSVDSVEAETDVLTCLAALCRQGGMVIFSGRSRDSVEMKEVRQTINTDPDTRYVHFLDENGLSAMYSHGVWRFQKFHTLSEVRTLTERHFGHRYGVWDSEGTAVTRPPIRVSGWGVVARNDRGRPPAHYLPSLEREFNLPLPGGKSFGRSADIRAAYLAAVEKEQPC